ncbi:MAG: tRNA (adenosine(37)-N6)-threonylcarbamoyltransferase complex transferase subunit TsaD [Verrucomicrobiota bacterium]|nr:tRNA (adenosine(37)-N6)-threonylcarbamoyltransferase complex transferase subunit TsaD [Verrucomicrobiota bacterium]
MIVLGIETTCDETGASLVRNGREILSNVIASSADIHEKYGGVFPELACRRHLESILPVIQEALVAPVDAIAIARGPGLVGALLVGMQVAKGLHIAWKKPLIGINHVEAHLYAALMGTEEWRFPALGVLLSGGHTFLTKISSVGSYELLGTTVDDAIGEAFDKVGTMLGLSYPGGPKVELLARGGDPKRFPFSPGRVKTHPQHFSFSGLKTAVLYAMQKEKMGEQEKRDLAASFQETAFTDVVHKAKKAIETFPCQAIYFGGGVTCNERLRLLFKKEFPDLPLFWPPKNLSLDNAAMIAGLGYHKLLIKQEGDPLSLEVQTRIPIDL